MKPEIKPEIKPEVNGNKTDLSLTGEYLTHLNVFKLGDVLIRDWEPEQNQFALLLTWTSLSAKTLSEKTIQQQLNGKVLYLTIMVLSSGKILKRSTG